MTSALLVLVIFYTLPLFVAAEKICAWGNEDALVENLTALIFLLGGILFIIPGIRRKNVALLALALLMPLAAGEEISWGQRLFDFETPEALQERNVQGEFNLHNLDTFSSFDENGEKTGWKRFLNTYMLFYAFCVAYGVIIPLLARFSVWSKEILQRFRIPYPPLSLGIFFLLNILIYKGLLPLLISGESMLHLECYFDEGSECYAAFLFVLIAVSLHRD